MIENVNSIMFKLKVLHSLMLFVFQTFDLAYFDIKFPKIGATTYW